jgi:hypothetical protein
MIMMNYFLFVIMAMAITVLILFTENNCESSSIVPYLAYKFILFQEFPTVRYCAPKSAKDTTMPTTFRELVSTKLAAELWDRLVKYKSAIPNYPQTETCELLIVDRSIDPVTLLSILCFQICCV